MSEPTLQRRGFWLCLEGPDGTGKTTLAASLHRLACARYPEVLLLREPGGTALGEHLRAMLKGRLEFGGEILPRAEALMLETARAQLMEEVVEPALARGAGVITDRGALSSLVYQGLGRGLGVDAIRQLNSFSTGGANPDLTLCLYVDAQTARARREGRSSEGPDRFESAGEAFLDKVREGYRELASGRENCELVDASGNPQQVLEECLRRLRNHGLPW